MIRPRSVFLVRFAFSSLLALSVGCGGSGDAEDGETAASTPGAAGSAGKGAQGGTTASGGSSQGGSTSSTGGASGKAGSGGKAQSGGASGQGGMAAGAGGSQGGSSGNTGKAGNAGQGGSSGNTSSGGNAGQGGSSGNTGTAGNAGSAGDGGQGGSSGNTGTAGQGGAAGDAGAAGAGGDSGGATGTAGSGGDAGQAGAGTAGTSQGGSSQGGSGQAGSAQAGSPQGGSGQAGSTGGGECNQASDCDALFGAAPCGVWACNASNNQCEASAPSCTDADQDGYGAGNGCACAAIDCDDADPQVGAAAVVTCYGGPAGTDGVGTCRAGTSTCQQGVFGPCTGEVRPSGEACNGLDDDCDGQVDDDLGTFSCGIGACATTVQACASGAINACVPPTKPQGDATCDGIDDDCDGAIDEDCATCVAVSPTGNDASADGTPAKPFRTIQAAINHAAASNLPRVCVAAGASCGQTGTYTNQAGQTVTMASGVSVYGNYESTSFTRCAAGSNTVTVIQPRTAEGVTFGAQINAPTVLDGFRVDRFNNAATAAVTVNGSKQVTLSNITISNTPSVQTSIGVDISGGAEVTITASSIYAGNGSVASVGVRSVASKPTIRSNCASLDAAGRCDDFCGPTNPGIRGRFTSNDSGTGVSAAVWLKDSPGAVIEQTAMCGVDSDQGAGIRVQGDATGTVIRSSLVNAWGGKQDSHGIWLEDCAGAAPWIVDNHFIAAEGDDDTTRVAGIRAEGACHPVIDSNVTINGGGEGSAFNPSGIYCGQSGGVASQCVVLNNTLIQGSSVGFPQRAVGIECKGGGCARIAGNEHITGRGGMLLYGIWIEKSGVVIDDNRVDAGCGYDGAGVLADDSWARIENNRIFGIVCPASSSIGASTSFGLRVRASAGANELDVHSNFLDGAGQPNCSGAALALDALAPLPTAPLGVYRNNILRAGTCLAARHGLIEQNAAADPRLVENNDFDPIGAPTALYLDEGATPLVDAASINALADTAAASNISADPLVTGYPNNVHIGPGSPCDGAGTAQGAPPVDQDGDPRDPQTPDIGPDER